MLDPRDRTLLFEALKPPEEYALDYAIGTTYSLDLIALLSTPLAFALLDRTNREGQLVSDPGALLTALRRYAGCISIFAQAGEVKIPVAHARLVAFLERSVVEVAAPRGGVFHPKVWALRFKRDGYPARYRVICASRNLTFDRSWDTMLVLEGYLRDRRNAYSRNHPLADFFAALPSLSCRGMTDALQTQILRFSEDLRKVEFVMPEPFESLAFEPIGIKDYEKSPIDGPFDEFLVVSPFVTAGALQDLRESVGKKGKFHLVSRAEELELVSPEILEACASVQAFNDSDPEDIEAADPGQVVQELSGLHAKLYIADHGWDSSVWCGSANATTAGFNANVEFLTRLVGKKSKVGINAFLSGEKGQAAFGAFLEPFQPAEPSEEALAARALEKVASDVARSIALADWTLDVTPAEGGHELRLILQFFPVLPTNVQISVKAWPITCTEAAMARPVLFTAPGVLARFECLTTAALTGFVAFCVELEKDGRHAPPQRFALSLPVSGMPENRDALLTASMLASAEDVSRYIMLLARGAEDLPPTDNQFVLGPGASDPPLSKGEGVAEGLLEALVRALHSHPESLDEIARTVDDLKAAGVAQERLPQDWDSIWEPILKVRKELMDAQ